jgi:hypothetical protein
VSILARRPRECKGSRKSARRCRVANLDRATLRSGGGTGRGGNCVGERGWLSLALGDGTPKRAATVAVVVGTILVAINQGDVILAGNWPILWKVGLTYLVPYCVTTYGAVTAKRAMLRARRPSG